MHPFYQQFLGALEAEDKNACITLALTAVDKGTVDLVTLYTEIIIPALRETEAKCDLGGLCVWKSQVRSSIVRTIMECCYPLISEQTLDTRHETSGKRDRVIVVSPEDEFDDIEARMIADFFALAGHEVIFVGSDTPTSEIVQALGLVKPAFLVLVVSNFYSIVEIQNSIEQLKAARDEQKLTTKMVVSGRAFPVGSDLPAKVGADAAVSSFQNIVALTKGGSHVRS